VIIQDLTLEVERTVKWPEEFKPHFFKRIGVCRRKNEKSIDFMAGEPLYGFHSLCFAINDYRG
jgi:hypothetical protein